MKALSLRQPWAWAILHAGKRVENRPWSSSFRGPFLIHASSVCLNGDYLDAVEWMIANGYIHSAADVPPRAELPKGGIVGRASIVDVLEPLEAVENLKAVMKRGPELRFGRAPWHIPTQFGFVLDDVAELPFRPLRGLLGFFDSELPALQKEPVAP